MKYIGKLVRAAWRWPRGVLAGYIARHRTAAFLYRQYLRWRLSFSADFRSLRKYEQDAAVVNLAREKFAGYGSAWSAISGSSVICDIFFFPRKIRWSPTYTRETRYNWYLSIAKMEGRPWWDNLTLALGKFVVIGIRWDLGERQYVSIRFWLDGRHGMVRTVREFFQQQYTPFYELRHELMEIGYKREYKISKWWWGSGYFERQMARHHREKLYKKFGKLFYWRSRSGEWKGYFGTDLSPEIKQDLFYQYGQEQGQYPIRLVGKDEDMSEIYLDAILGRKHDLYADVFPVRCIDCHRLHNPYDGDDYPNWLRCRECGYAYNEVSNELGAIAA